MSRVNVKRAEGKLPRKGRVEVSGDAREFVAGCASYRSLRDAYFANVLKDCDRGAAA